MSIRLIRGPLSVSRAYAELEDAASGAVVLFLGRVRPDRTGRSRVRALDYETHRELAEGAFEDLVRKARRRFGVRGVVVWHRFGVVRVGEPSVIVGVSALHRAAAFQAARFLIEELKKTAPIWKHDLTTVPRTSRRRASS